MSLNEQVTNIELLNFLGKQFKVKCSPEQRTFLYTAAEYLNARMLNVQNGDQFATIDRIAIVTGLNLVQELLTRDDGLLKEQIKVKINQLSNKINNVLANLT